MRLDNLARPESFEKVPEVVGQEFLDEVVLPEVVGVRGGERHGAIELHYAELGLLAVAERVIVSG